MFPAIPEKAPQLCISISLALMFFGYLLFTAPFTVLSDMANKQTELTKASNLDIKSYCQDSIDLVQAQATIREENIVLAKKSPDSIKLQIENNNKFAERNISIQEFFQEHRPQQKSLEVLEYINSDTSLLTNYIPIMIKGGAIIMIFGSGGFIFGIILVFIEYRDGLREKRAKIRLQ